jgi:hypothetical protein
MRPAGAWHEYAAWQFSWSTIMWSFLTLEHVHGKPAAFNALVVLLIACHAQGPACVVSHQNMGSPDPGNMLYLVLRRNSSYVTCWAVSCVDGFANLLA